VFDGQQADVVGFVYHDARLAEGQFLVGRFTVTCCVADAAAIGMIVIWPPAQALPANAWVRVRGAVSAATLDGRPIPLIAAESVEQVAEPDNPYLYP
jgi:putative membrane protein